MSAFQIIDDNTVKTERRGAIYTVQRVADGFRVYCVNASSLAYRRGIPAGRSFATLQEVEAGYKGLVGIAGAFPS